MADLSKKIADAKARHDAAKKLLSDADRLEIAQRAELAKINADRLEEERKSRELDLDRRLDKAHEELGEDVRISALAIQGYEDTFILRYDGAAHAQWTKALSNAAHAKQMGNGAKYDRDQINCQYALDCIYDWNGHTDFDDNAERSTDLRKYLIENNGLLSPLTNEASALAGVYAEERKSAN